MGVEDALRSDDTATRFGDQTQTEEGRWPQKGAEGAKTDAIPLFAT
jgi:hypothetical protein